MKKKTTGILLALLLFLLCFALVACNDGANDKKPIDGENGGDPEVTYFDVIFDSNGGTSLSNYNTKVAYGQTVSAPVNASNEPLIPIKKGYTFSGWTLNGGDTYDFANYTITANTTIKAAWSANTYNHTAYLFDEKLKDNIIGIGDESAEAYYGDDVKIVDGDGNDKAIEGSNPRRYTLPTTYQTANATPRQSIDAPVTTKSDDYFVFWYYYSDTDNDGEEDDIVRFTNVRDSASTGQATLANAYDIDGALTLYAMWHSSLDNVTVTFDSVEGTQVDAVTKKEFDTLAKPENPTKSGYEFDYWYYTEEDENENVKEYKFNFDDPTTAEDDNMADLLAKDVNLKAKWVKKYEIGASNASLLATALSDTENLNAKIYINENITLNNWSAKCDNETPFTGTIDGGTYRSDGTLNTEVPYHVITLSNIEAGQYNSLLISNNGTIKNLRIAFENISLQDENGNFDELEDEKTVYVAAVAAFNGDNAVINSVYATVSGIVSTAHEIVFGGLVAVNNGGEIYDSNVAMTAPLTVTATDSTACVGGFVGFNDEKGGFVQNCIVNPVQISVSAQKGHAGGFFGKTNSGTSKENIVKNGFITVNATEKAVVGGFAGFLFAGSCNQFYIDTNVNINALTTAANGITLAGGVVGENWGQVLNCQIDKVSVSSTATGQNATNYAGGVTGYNFTDGGSARGTVKSVMLFEGSVNVVANASGAKGYAGGITGRNYSGIISNVYGSVNVTATVDSQLEKTVGYVVGDSRNSSYSSVYYDNAKSLNRNGVVYEINPQEMPTFEVFIADNINGISPDSEGAEEFNNIRNVNWLTNSLALDSTAWNVPVSNGNLPALLFLGD